MQKARNAWCSKCAQDDFCRFHIWDFFLRTIWWCFKLEFLTAAAQSMITFERQYPPFTKLSVIPAHFSMTILNSLFSPRSLLLPSLAFLRLFLYTLSHYLLSVCSPLIVFCFQSKQHLFFSACRIFINVSSQRASTRQFWDVPSDLKHLTNVHIILWLWCSVDIMFTRNSTLSSVSFMNFGCHLKLKKFT